MITTSKHYIMGGAQRIWDIDRETLLERIANCMKLNDEYQKAFHRYRLLNKFSTCFQVCVVPY